MEDSLLVPHRLARPLAWSIVLVVLVLAGCSDGSSGEGDGDGDGEVSVLESIRAATVEAGGTRVEGTVESATGTGAVTGRVSADGGQGEVAVGVPVGVPPVSFVGWRWNDGTVWSELAPEATTDEPDRPWRQGTFDVDSAVSLAAYAPAVLLDVLVANEAEPVAVVERDDAGAPAGGPADDAPDDLRRLEVQLPGAMILVTRYSQAELWVDADDRLVRVRVEGRGASADVEVVEWGVDASDVEPPSDDQLGGPAGPVAVADGPWEQVAAGDDVGVRWSLERAPGTRSTVCWRLLSEPEVSTRATGDDAEWCQRPATDDDLPEDRVQVVVDAVDPEVDVLVLVVPVGSEVTITDVAGAPNAVAVSGEGFASWFAPAADYAVLVEVTLADGDAVVCGPDIVSDLDDLDFIDPDVDLRLEPWFCREA